MTNDDEDVQRAAAPSGRPTATRAPRRMSSAIGCAGLAAFTCSSARASLFQGDALDAVADAIAWVALVVGPLVLIAVFWLVHILPEKIAEKRRHPQAKAIQTLCLLSLFFGGLLWPVAWLWAYTKPVLHKLAYGTDVDEHEELADRATEAPPGNDLGDAARTRMKVVDGHERGTTETSAGREHA